MAKLANEESRNIANAVSPVDRSVVCNQLGAFSDKLEGRRGPFNRSGGRETTKMYLKLVWKMFGYLCELHAVNARCGERREEGNGKATRV